MTCILIEDDIAWRSKLQMMLDELDITILGIATTVTESVQLLSKHKPHFIVADILLEEKLVFDALTPSIKTHNTPIIFITNSDKEIHYKRAISDSLKQIYLVKPIHKLTLKSAIENLVGSLDPLLTKKKVNSLKIKGKHNESIEIPFDKIVYLSQNLKYCTIHTLNKQFTLKKAMQQVIEMLDDRFLRVHISFCINTNFIQNFEAGLHNVKLTSNDIAVPIGIRYIDSVKRYIANKNVATL